MSTKTSEEVSEIISSSNYVRERLNPERGDFFYLHLSDLSLAMHRFASDEPLRILDFGCGGSPYRSLFPNARYERADVAGTPDVDYEISEGGYALPIPDKSYDLILSSQVLEHVSAPQEYLVEARRLLRPSGQLLLTTHGIFEDHGCPFDFRRWTDLGLRLELVDAGFNVSQILKLTTGPRAAMFLMQQHQGQPSRKLRLGRLLWLLNRMIAYRRSSFDQQCDQAFSNNRVVAVDLDQHRIYIALLAIAERTN